MTKSTIDGKVPATWVEVQRDLTALQAQAMARQDVSADDLKLVEQGIAELQASDTNTANTGNYERLIGTVQNLQGIASSSTHATNATNANWAAEMNDVTHLAAQMSTSKTVATPNQKIFGSEVDASTLPGDAAQAKGTMYAVNSDPASYAAETSTGYTTYDSQGTLTGTFTKDQKPAIDLGDGQVLKLSSKGFGDSWISNSLDDYSTKERAADWKPSAADTDQASGGSVNPSLSINGDAKGPGPGTAYLNMPSGAKALPGELATLQKTQQVNFLKDAKPPVYVTSTATTPITYSVYNEDGSKRAANLAPPLAIGMANGSWFAASSKGLASSWTTTDPTSLDMQTQLYDLSGSGPSDTTLAEFKGQTAAAGNTASINGSEQGPGPGTAYLNMPAGATSLPGVLATLQKTQQVNFLKDAKPPVYVTSTSTEPATYGVYNQDGSKRGGDLKAPFAIGMGNGSWFAASPKGVGSAWTTTDPKSLEGETKLYDLNGSGASDTTLAPVAGQAAASTDSSSASSGGASQAFTKATAAEIAALPANEKANAQRPDVVYTLDTSPKTMLVQQDNNTSYRLYTMDGKPTAKKPETSTNDLDNYARLDADSKDVIALNGGKFLQLGAKLTDAKVYDKAEDVTQRKTGKDNTFLTISATTVNFVTIVNDAKLFPTAKQTEENKTVEAKTPKFTTGDKRVIEKDLKKDSSGKYHTILGVGTSDSMVTAHVWSKSNPDAGSNQHDISLLNANGEELLPKGTKGKGGLRKGEFGSVALTNGGKFVSTSSGYWLINGDEAQNIASGETKPKKTIEDELAGLSSKNPPMNQSELERARKDQTSPTF